MAVDILIVMCMKISQTQYVAKYYLNKKIILTFSLIKRRLRITIKNLTKINSCQILKVDLEKNFYLSKSGKYYLFRKNPNFC